MNDMFKGLFDTDMTAVIAVGDFLKCVLCALGLGLVLAGAYMIKSRYTKSFVVTLAILPAVVSVVIMMVNGNVGTGVAVAGAFSLVRFRSVPGTAKEIAMLFLAMGTGLIIGMGYLGFAALFVLVMSVMTLVYNLFDFGAAKNAARYKSVRITMPEDLDYGDVFTDIFQKYTTRFEAVKVKTVGLGSMFRITYNVCMKAGASEKNMIDELRCRNGNLEISVSRQETMAGEL